MGRAKCVSYLCGNIMMKDCHFYMILYLLNCTYLMNHKLSSGIYLNITLLKQNSGFQCLCSGFQCLFFNAYVCILFVDRIYVYSKSHFVDLFLKGITINIKIILLLNGHFLMCFLIHSYYFHLKQKDKTSILLKNTLREHPTRLYFLRECLCNNFFKIFLFSVKIIVRHAENTADNPAVKHWKFLNI